MDFPLWVDLGVQGASVYLPFVVAGTFLFRVLHFPDLGVEGSFAVGAAIATVVSNEGGSTMSALGTASALGGAMGLITASLFVAGRLNAILCGIVTAFIGYTVCWALLGGRSSVPIPRDGMLGIEEVAWVGVALFAGLLVVLSTRMGLVARMAAENPLLVSHMGLNPGTSIAGLVVLGNGMVAMSGACVVLKEGNTTLSVGGGKLYLLLMAIAIGEGIFVSVAGSWRLVRGLIFAIHKNETPADQEEASASTSVKRLSAVGGFGSGTVIFAATIGMYGYWFLWEAAVELFGAREWSKLVMGLFVMLVMLIAVRGGKTSRILPPWKFHGAREWS